MPRVALVDDDIEFLDELADHLSAAGYSVSVWHRPTLAWRFVRRERPEALLLDFDMPGVSGLQILQRLRASSETRSIPVLLLTAHDHPDVRTGGWSHQLDDFIPKGTGLAEIRLRLARAIERSQDHQVRASTSGLPSGAAGRTHFAQAMRRASSTLFVLQLPGLAGLALSDRPELSSIFGELLQRLGHRLRDALSRPGIVGSGPALAPAWERDPETILFLAATPAGVDSSDDPLNAHDRERAPVELERAPVVAQMLRRRIQAANRLLARAAGGGRQYCLVPEHGRLVRRELPAFRLCEFRPAPGQGRDLDRLLALASDLLDAGQTPPGYSVYDL
ncbi:MAG: response regulator [bacterium]|nr:response regulator [bacterium]